MAEPFVLPVSIYYEDTDHSGVVYHANYLRYFERAREHVLGRAELTRMYREEGLGFVVYKASMSFHEGAVFGDDLEVRTVVEISSPFRAVFHQAMWRPGGRKAMVEAEIHLVCVKDGQLVKLPQKVMDTARSTGAVQ
jgi:tol-pal system-associated acyl-CoA thioesterase